MQLRNGPPSLCFFGKQSACLTSDSGTFIKNRRGVSFVGAPVSRGSWHVGERFAPSPTFAGAVSTKRHELAKALCVFIQINLKNAPHGIVLVYTGRLYEYLVVGQDHSVYHPGWWNKNKTLPGVECDIHWYNVLSYISGYKQSRERTCLTTYIDVSRFLVEDR